MGVLIRSKQIHICLAIFIQYLLNHLWVEPPLPSDDSPSTTGLPQYLLGLECLLLWGTASVSCFIAALSYSVIDFSSRCLHASIYKKQLLCCLIWLKHKRPFICRRKCLRAKDIARNSRQWICISLTGSVHTPLPPWSLHSPVRTHL